MYRILLAFAAAAFILVIREIRAPERAVDRLVSAPYGVERSEIRPGPGWREYPDGEIKVRTDQGFALALLEKQYRRSLSLRLFTYAEPSLDSSFEVLLMGSLEGIVSSEEAARKLRDRFRSRMSRRGFAESFSDRVAFGGLDGLSRKGLVPLGRGDLAAHVYYAYDSRRQIWIVRAAVQDPLARTYGDPVRGRWSRWRQTDRMTIPDRLIRDLEAAGVRSMLGEESWARILDISRTGGRGFRVFDYLRFIRMADPAAFVPERRPALLLFRNYLARYLFSYGIPRWGHERRPDEYLDALGLEYSREESGRRVVYGESCLFELARKYPDSYWGQAAFVEIFRLGFRKPLPNVGGTARAERERRGKDFLERWPDSEFAPDVCFCLGKDAEEEFSYYLVRSNRSYHLRNRWRKHPLDAETDSLRGEAIQWYERVLASPKREEYGDHLTYILPRLRMGIATGPGPWSPW